MQHLYGVTKKDHINYSYISSVEQKNGDNSTDNLEVNHLSMEQRRVVLPGFKDMVNYVHEMAQKRANNPSAQKYVYGRATLMYSYEVFTEVRRVAD